MQVTTIGLDLAKNAFQVHGVDADGGVVVRKKLRRVDVLAFFSTLPPCLVGVEACASAHHWARELTGLGHEVKLMAPSYVKPYVKRGKNDAADAEAICEAVTRPTMRFVPAKSAEQQSALMLHLGRSSKMGDRYIRRLLVVGATALIRFARNRSTPLAAWADALLAHRPARLVSVALANKMARIAWAVQPGARFRRGRRRDEVFSNRLCRG